MTTETTETPKVDRWVMLTRSLRCSTLEQCREIQKGSLIFRRVSKWIALCSIGITCSVGYWVNKFQEKAIAYMNEYDRLVSSNLVKWFYHAPSTDWIRELIKFYNAVSLIQVFILVAVSAYTARWVYADSVVRRKSFWFGLVLILAVNCMIYFVFSSWWFYQKLLNMV